jgi:hypothetical protein
VNLVLSFIHPSAPPRTLGPLKQLWIDTESLRESRDGPVLARHTRHQWEVAGERYFRMDCTARVTIRFEGGATPPSQAFGPFGRFSAVDGLAYTDDEVFAHVDEKVGAWLCYDVGRHWPVMIVGEAS